eukprot:549670-Prymnesium_polylepis.2
MAFLAAENVPPTGLLGRLGWRPARDFSPIALFELYVPPGLFFLNMYFITGIKGGLEMLVCIPDGGTEGKSFLKLDPNVTCWHGDHWGNVALAAFALLVYLCVVPLIYAHVVFVVVPRDPKAREARALAFLYKRFEPEFKFWELLEVLRKVIYTMLSVLLHDSVLNRSLGLFFATAFLMVLHLIFRPFKCAASPALLVICLPRCIPSPVDSDAISRVVSVQPL